LLRSNAKKQSKRRFAIACRATVVIAAALLPRRGKAAAAGPVRIDFNPPIPATPARLSGIFGLGVGDQAGKAFVHVM